MTDLEKTMSIIETVEGGYVNDPDDPGGETKYGISKRSYPNTDIKNLTLSEAQKLYKKDFWEKYKCDKMPYPVNTAYMVSVINMPYKTAGSLLQKAISVGGNPILIDGYVGPKTLKALNNSDSLKVASLFVNYCLVYYRKLASSGRLKKYLRTWTYRLMIVINEVMSSVD